MKEFIFTITFILSLNILIFCQSPKWFDLQLLKSTRTDVENIFGKPKKFFTTFGRYDDSAGEYSVWYSSGKCEENVKGLQWKVPAGQVIAMDFVPKGILAVPTFVRDGYRKEKIPNISYHYLYYSPDESTTYSVIITDDDPVGFVVRIGIQPNKDKQYLLCKDISK